MISSLFFDKTPADLRLDAPVDSTVHVPLNLGRALLRMLSLIIMAGGSLYAIVTVAIHFNDPTFLTKMGDANTVVGDSVTAVRILQIVIAAATLLVGVLGILRSFALMQSRESGLMLGPRGITIACDLRKTTPRWIGWRSIASIDQIKRGVPAVVLRLRPPDDAAGDYRYFKFWPGSRVIIQTRALLVKPSDLKILIDRYFTHYAIPQSPSSKESS